MAYSYRCVWENSYQWKARTTFLDIHRDKFSDARLASLSMAWANWKFMGCQYPEEVQTLLETLDQDMPEEFESCGHTQSLTSKKQSKCKHLRGNRIQSNTAPDVVSITPKRMPNRLILFISSEFAENPISILNESAQKSGCSVEFQESCQIVGSKTLYCTSVVIDGKVVATGNGSNKKDAKRDAADKAIALLKETHQVVEKRLQHDKCEIIEKKDLVKSAYKNAPKISEDNIGNQLLRKMGWDGQRGLGKEGNIGRSEPVFVESAEGRQGLGIEQSIDCQILHKRTAENVLLKFIRNPDESVIRFEAGLSKEDRATLHKLSGKFGLSHKSFGTGESRYLVIQKKVSIHS